MRPLVIPAYIGLVVILYFPFGASQEFIRGFRKLNTLAGNLQVVGNNAEPIENFPLQMCQGDCDRDWECAPGLRCFFRRDFTEVPGCLGYGAEGADYCYLDPDDPPDMYSPPNILNYWGNNGFPQSHFPLKKCQGDCDTDDDCYGSLKCFNRTASESVPGCYGWGEGGKDYCYDEDDPLLDPWEDESFRLRLYWEDGYEWQETSQEFFWCLECGGNSHWCQEDDEVEVQWCIEESTRFLFENINGDTTRIRVSATNLCLHLVTSTRVRLKECSNSNSQRFEAVLGALDSYRFDLRPANNHDRCLSQHHHPKAGEEVYPEKCDRAHPHTTGYWNKLF